MWTFDISDFRYFVRLSTFKSSFSVIQRKTQDAVDIWMTDKFSVTCLIFSCFGLMAPKHIFPSKNVIKTMKVTEIKQSWVYYHGNKPDKASGSRLS